MVCVLRPIVTIVPKLNAIKLSVLTYNALMYNVIRYIVIRCVVRPLNAIRNNALIAANVLIAILTIAEIDMSIINFDDIFGIRIDDNGIMLTNNQCNVVSTNSNTWNIQNCTTINCTTVQCNTIQCNTVNCTTINCTTIQCTTVDCTTVQCSKCSRESACKQSHSNDCRD